MRIALISDLHSNYEALRSLGNVLHDADAVLCLGDIVGYYCQVNETLDFLRDLNPRCVLGNHDSFLLHGCPVGVNRAVAFGVEYADRVIRPEHRAWLGSLPLSWGGQLDGLTFFLAHGSPWRPLADYLYADNPRLAALDEFAYDVIAFGQTHRGYRRLERRPLLLNPGSVGQARDVRGYACCLTIETDTLRVESVTSRYDAARVMEHARRHGAGEWITSQLI